MKRALSSPEAAYARSLNRNASAGSSMKNPERLGHFAEIALVLVCLDHVAAASYTRITASCEQSLLLFSRTMGDDIGFHDAVAGIVRCGQCVRVGRNVSPEILHLGPLAVDLSLVVIYECVALPMRGAPQLATGISWRFEASEKPIALLANASWPFGLDLYFGEFRCSLANGRER
jgi:hypothetical protein